MLTIIFHLVQRFNAQTKIEEVCFEYAAPKHESKYQRTFLAHVHFEQQYTGIRLDPRALEAVSPWSDPGLHEALRSFAAMTVA